MDAIKRGGITIPYVVQGDGAQHIVFAHGLMGMGAVQRAQMGPLVEAGWTVVTFDQRGHAGASPITETAGYDPDEMGLDLWAVADAAGLHRCWIGGGSMGAATSWCAARANPERVEGLVQTVPALHDEPHQAIFMFDALADHLADAGIEGLIEAIERFVQMGGQAVDRDFLEQLRSHDAASLEVALRSVPRWVLSDVPSGFGSLPFSVVVMGWDGDPIHPLQTARDIALSAGADLIEMDMAATTADPALFGRTLRDVLSKVPA